MTVLLLVKLAPEEAISYCLMLKCGIGIFTERMVSSESQISVDVKVEVSWDLTLTAHETSDTL